MIIHFFFIFFFSLPCCLCRDQKHVVFGQVLKGYNVVKAMEACGSRSGETAHDVMVSNSGVVSGGKGATTTTAALQQQQAAAAPRLARASARAAPAGTLGQLKQQRRAVLQGRTVAPARRPRAAVHAAAAVPMRCGIAML